MSDDETSNEQTTPQWQAAPVPPSTDATDDSAGPATEPEKATRGPRRLKTREALAAGAVGLVVAGGLAGFGIGRATAGSDDPATGPAGRQLPGGYGFDGQRGQRPDGGGFGRQDGQDGGQQDGQQDGQDPGLGGSQDDTQGGTGSTGDPT